MSRNLVVCCDGTGNVWSPSKGTTNVVRLVQALLRDSERQIYYYDPGVGTPDGYLADAGGGLSWKDIARRVGGLAWGDGVWTNVAEAYLFLVEQYRPGDRIFLFGFSRGAFTARAVGGLIHLCGLLERGHENLVPALLKVYRARAGARRDQAGAALKASFSHADVPLHFTGVWDTVESVGIVRLLVGAHITSNREVKPTYRHVRHAVALDEQRAPYLPRLYDPPPAAADPERSFKQVYFCGAHSDVGGGYAQDGLSNAALHWIAREANALGLLLRPEALDRHVVNPLAKLHDQAARLPLWVLAGVFTRELAPGPVTVHESVAARIAHRAAGYRPALPAQVEVERTADTVIHPDGRREQRPVPTEARLAVPARQPIRPWLYVWLAAAAVATGACLYAWFAEMLPLVKLQLWRGAAGLFDLGGAVGALCGGDAACLGRLLLKDAVLIASYLALLPVLLLLLVRFSGANGIVSRPIGRAARAGAVLPVADAIENWATMGAWSAQQAATCSPLPCGWVEGLHSLLCTLAAVAKFGALAVLLVLPLACIAARLRAPRPRAPAG